MASRRDAVSALASANIVRADRSAFKKLIAAHPQHLIEAVRERCVPDNVKRMRVWDALIVLPGMGRRTMDGRPAHVAMILREAGIDTSRTLGALTDRQQVTLCAALERFSRTQTGKTRKGWEA